MTGIVKGTVIALNKLLGLLGLRLIRSSNATIYTFDFDQVISTLAARRLPVSTVVDIGASDGHWSEKLQKYYPDSHYFLIEGNPRHESALHDICDSHPRMNFVIAVASDSAGSVHFDDSDLWTGIASHSAPDGSARKFPSTTVDLEVKTNSLQGPFLLKFDTHGFEVPILKGALNTLAKTNIIIMETYNFHPSDECLRFWEMCEHLVKSGFRPINLMEPINRPKDGAFWQVDIVFVRSDRPEFDDNNYR